MKVKALFFDATKVQRAVDKAKRRELSRAGAFVRQRAKTSMRRRKGPAPPGKPPHAHEGSLRRFIFFAFEPQSESVVVGPMRLNRIGDAPSALEFGGQTSQIVREFAPGPLGRSVKRRRRFTIKARPYMGPALRAELPNFPKQWANSVRGG